MMYRKVILILYLLPSVVSCQTAEDELVRQKNKCYKDHFVAIKDKAFYNGVFKSFTDTFAIIKTGRLRPSLLEEKIDDAIFFKKDSLECILIVLERDDDKEGEFGSARSYRGQVIDGRWKFQKSMWFTYGNDYYEKYNKNSFENISELARYSVLTQGEVEINGCEIDEYFWFKYLKE